MLSAVKANDSDIHYIYNPNNLVLMDTFFGQIVRNCNLTACVSCALYSQVHMFYSGFDMYVTNVKTLNFNSRGLIKQYIYFKYNLFSRIDC